MRWRVDVGLVVLAALVSIFFMADSGLDYPVVDLIIGVGSAAALLVARRRWTVPIALTLIPLMAVSTLSMGPAAVALGVVARYRRWPATLLVVAVHLVLVVGAFTLLFADDPEYPVAVVAVVAVDAALVASGKLVRSQRLLVESWQARAREAEEGQRLRLEEARHAERERIAREMHDVLAHRISLLAVQAGALEVRRSAPEDERRAAGIIRESAYAVLEDLREVIGMLRSDDTDPDRPQPTLADVPALVEQSRLAGAPITLEMPDTLEQGTDGRHVYRVVQEGLTNARKHAPDVPVRVVLADRDGGVAVEITNRVPDLIGAGLPGAGSGLVGLRERMELIGGTLEHGHIATGEFRLCAWVPERTP